MLIRRRTAAEKAFPKLKHCGRDFFLATVVLLCAILPLNAARAQSPLRIAYTDFAPFHSRGPGKPLEGFFHAIISEALEQRMGIPLKWTAYPWKRCQYNVRAGIDDALLTVPTAERLAYAATHATPFYRKNMHIFTRADHPRLVLIKTLASIAAIKENKLAVVTYNGNSWHQTKVASLGITTYETDPIDNVWRMLAAGRGDLVIEWPHGAWPAIRRLRLASRLTDTGVRLASMSFHLLIRKNSSHVTALKDFEEVIQEMHTDGTIAAILAPFEGE
jgi:polar amino acid transport system substrate-binding protein